jgi:putative acetyltransferase
MGIMVVTVNTIAEEDNRAICSIIKSVFEEHGINRPGTAYYDEALHSLSSAFAIPGSIYLIAKLDGVICGGAGVYPTDGLPHNTCELVKMYLLPEARGKGVGKILIERCIDFARNNGYKKMYLETMPELQKAVRIYERLGFVLLPAPMGNSGHYSCSIHMLKDI